MSEQSPEDVARWNEQIIGEFRDNNGKVDGMFEGVPLVLVTTAGRRTGRPRTNPVVHLRDGGRYLIFGSNLGEPKHPDWYHNMLASSQVTMEIGTDEGHVKPLATRAVVLDGEERDRLYERQCAIDPTFRAYQERTSRTIPVVALYPLDLSENTERNKAIGEQLVRHHDELRAELDRVRAEIDGVLAGGAKPETARRSTADLTEQLRRHCLTFCYGLRMHHTRENGAFSAFERAFPHLVSVIDRLREEHRVVEETLAGFEAFLDRGPTDERTETAGLRDELDQLVSGLEEHFAYEEAHLLPAIGAARTAGTDGR